MLHTTTLSPVYREVRSKAPVELKGVKMQGMGSNWFQVQGSFDEDRNASSTLCSRHQPCFGNLPTIWQEICMNAITSNQ